MRPAPSLFMDQVQSHKNKNSGITVVEVLVGIAIFSVALTILLLSLNLFLAARHDVNRETKALYLAEEGIEAVRYLRDIDWNVLTGYTVDTPYYLSMTTSTVALGTSPVEVIDTDFRREIVFREVYRDNTTDDIVASTSGSNYLDTGSLEVEARVGFDTTTTTLSTILTNIFDI